MTSLDFNTSTSSLTSVFLTWATLVKTIHLLVLVCTFTRSHKPMTEQLHKNNSSSLFKSFTDPQYTLQFILAVRLTFTVFSLSCRRHMLFRSHLACLISTCSRGFLLTDIFFLLVCFLFRSFLVEIRSGTMLHRRGWILFGIFRRLRISLCNCPDEGKQKSKQAICYTAWNQTLPSPVLFLLSLAT